MSDPKRYDDVIGMLTDQCHQYALEVERLKAAPHDDDTCPHLVRANLLEAENARLKEEVHRLEEIVGSDAIDRKYGMCCDASDEHARLKAEVDKLNATIQQMYVDFEKRFQKEAAHPACVKLNRLVGDKNNEIHRLKDEVERLTAFTTRTIIPNEELQAQVERLTIKLGNLNVFYDEALDKNDNLKAQVERLTKAGDKLHAFLINYIVEGRISSAYLNKLDDDWSAAKEGKQP